MNNSGIENIEKRSQKQFTLAAHPSGLRFFYVHHDLHAQPGDTPKERSDQQSRGIFYGLPVAEE